MVLKKEVMVCCAFYHIILWDYWHFIFQKGYTDAYGVYRTVEYTADSSGFHANIKVNFGLNIQSS